MGGAVDGHDVNAGGEIVAAGHDASEGVDAKCVIVAFNGYRAYAAFDSYSGSEVVDGVVKS